MEVCAGENVVVLRRIPGSRWPVQKYDVDVLRALRAIDTGGTV